MAHESGAGCRLLPRENVLFGRFPAILLPSRSSEALFNSGRASLSVRTEPSLSVRTELVEAPAASLGSCALRQAQGERYGRRHALRQGLGDPLFTVRAELVEALAASPCARALRQAQGERYGRRPAFRQAPGEPLFTVRAEPVEALATSPCARALRQAQGERRGRVALRQAQGERYEGRLALRQAQRVRLPSCRSALPRDRSPHHHSPLTPPSP
jgi:hypothetical protein